uniref:Transmembrane protein n=1 Tax=Anisakis simplex TaxID=6269 RepID=A0A0M3JB55_ANISI
LALWTLVFSILYSYAWQQHRKKFLLSLFFVVPTVFAVCCGISTLLTAIVVLGRIFSTPIVYTDFLKCEDDPTTGQTSYPRRHRTYSGTSCRSSLSIRSATSAEDVHLPVPLCRRHSSSNGSINGKCIHLICLMLFYPGHGKRYSASSCAL